VCQESFERIKFYSYKPLFYSYKPLCTKVLRYTSAQVSIRQHTSAYVSPPVGAAGGARRPVTKRDRRQSTPKGASNALLAECTYVYSRDVDLAEIAHRFKRNMCTTEGIEVLGTPVGNDRFIQTFVAQNCFQIMGDIGKHACLTVGYVHAQLLKFSQNTRTQFISANIDIPDSDNVITAQHKHVDRKIAYETLQKGTRCSFRNWSQQDID
jgi:hypothetical protein